MAEAVVSRSSPSDHFLEESRRVGVRTQRDSSNAVETSDVERQALVDLYYSTNGEGWTESENWLDGDPCVNQWYGVTCDEHGGVVTVSLWNNNMTGALEESIGNFLHCRSLVLWAARSAAQFRLRSETLKMLLISRSTTTSLKERSQPRWGI